jgi:hypothetical protein
MNGVMSLVFWQGRLRLAGRKQWWWTLNHSNGNVVGGSTEGYENFRDAVDNANLVMGLSLNTNYSTFGPTVVRGVGTPRETTFHVEVER